MRGGTKVLLGRPCRQGEAPVGPMLDPDGCLARSAMRTQPSTEETDAVQTRWLETATGIDWAACAAKKMLCALDDRPANGCHRNSQAEACRSAKEVKEEGLGEFEGVRREVAFKFLCPVEPATPTLLSAKLLGKSSYGHFWAK